MYSICKLCELNQNLMCVHEESVAMYIDTLFKISALREPACKPLSHPKFMCNWLAP
jgi:hypothetical protein